MSSFSPSSLGISTPSGGFQQGGWYEGRQYWGGTLSDPGVIHEASNQQGAGQAVSAEVNTASAVQQGVSSQQFESYLQQQRDKQATRQAQPVSTSPGYTSPQFTDAGSTGAGVGFSAPTEINLPDLYKKLTADSGISDLQDKLAEQERAFTEAKGELDDNPFLSEATRVGKQAKLQKLFDDRTKNARDEIATKKADVETQLNLQLKQFDINSEQTRLAWDQFNTLLSAGALDNASGEDIANLTRATGIGSSMIYSAISANKKKNINTSVIQSTADSGEVTISVIDTDTGKVINQESLGFIGNKQGTSESTSVDKDEAREILRGDIVSEQYTFPEIVQNYSGILDNQEIYSSYNTYTNFGKPTDVPQGFSSTREWLESIGIES